MTLVTSNSSNIYSPFHCEELQGVVHHESVLALKISDVQGPQYPFPHP
jgi:hypothetical protein